MTDLIALTMPKWGLAMEEGTVTDWLIQPGGAVTLGAEIVEVETSKIANVVEAPATGTLLRTLASAGDTLPVGALLGVIGDAGASEQEIEAFVAANQALAAETAAVAEGSGGPLTVDAGGRAITYIEAGSGDATPLILIHGFCGDRNNWLFNLDALAKDRRVIALDLPGHGASAKDVQDGGVGQLAAAVVGLMDALGIDRAVLAGHSMGGATALTVALDYPERVAGVVALGSFGLGSPVNPAFVEDILAADRRKEMKSAMETLFADPALVSRDMIEALLSFKRIDGVQAGLDALALGALSVASGTALAARLDSLTVPLLALHGAEDRVIALPSRDGVEALPGIGHMLQMEAAARVNEAVAAFAAKVG